MSTGTSSENKIEDELRALADIVIECYIDFMKKGLIDKNGKLKNPTALKDLSLRP